jgi:hypothetical protein
MSCHFCVWQLSDELFHQWAQALVDSTTMHSAGEGSAVCHVVFSSL